MASPMRRPRRSPRDLAVRAAYHCVNLQPVRAVLQRRYDRAIRLHAPALPRLTGLKQEIAQTLARTGFYLSSLEALGWGGADRLLADASRAAALYRGAAHRGELFSGNRNLVPPRAIVANPWLFVWGVQDDLLDIVEHYLGLPPAYDGVQFSFAVPGESFATTELWHRDWEDRKVIKAAVYCDDVPAECAMQVLAREDPGEDEAQRFHYELLDTDSLRARCGPEMEHDIARFPGPRGTVLLVDTARFWHCGQRAAGGERKILFYSFFARPPRHPFFCERSGLTRREIGALAATMSDRSRDATLWRRSLPRLVRLIPPARL